MPKCDFNKVANQLYRNHFRTPFPKNTFRWLLLRIAPADQTSILETQFDIDPYDQNNNIEMNGPCNQPTNVILLKINKAILKMISSIYFNSKISNYGPYIKLLHLGPAKLELQFWDKILKYSM